MDLIYEIPDKIKVAWESSVRAVVDQWSGLAMVTVSDFRTAILEIGLPHAIAHGGRAYIVDNSAAMGGFSLAVQDFIADEVFPAFAKAGIKYFIIVPSAESPLANMSALKYEARLGPFGIEGVAAPSLVAAVAWLQEQASRDPGPGK
jgi:hypothetical protein